MKKNAILPEVLPKQTALAKADSALANNATQIERVAAELNKTYEQWQVVERANNMLMLKMGLMLQWVFGQLPHGEWESWCENYIHISQRHAHRFRAVAVQFAAVQKLELEEVYKLSVCDEQKKVQKFEQMAFAFLGTDSQADLFEKYKFLDGKRRGGDHGGGMARHEAAKMKHQLEVDHAREQWKLIVQYFREFALQKKGFLHVSPPVLAAGIESINECLRALPKE